ncbi:MAG: transporter [Bacteroidaceae bacterium]|nr:transporter [Bacteroidaceae bacterium]
MLKNWTLPVAIVTGTSLYLIFAFIPQLSVAADMFGDVISVVFPMSVFATLFVTFSKVDYHLMGLRRWHFAVVAAQLLLVALTVSLIIFTRSSGASAVVFCASILLALLTCIIAPCASASPVVTAKLGGNLTEMTSFVLLSSVVMAVAIPAVFPLVSPSAGFGFWDTFLRILEKMTFVLLLPLQLGAAVRMGARRKVAPLAAIYRFILATPDLAFYCWAFSLAITAGVTVRNIVHSEASPTLMSLIAILSFIVAVAQFGIGRLIGRRFLVPIESGQAMFQKNTALSIWVASLYLPPVASVGAGCYVLWQNIINSYELWAYRRGQASAAKS